jgi:hypothetical protein
MFETGDMLIVLAHLSRYVHVYAVKCLLMFHFYYFVLFQSYYFFADCPNILNAMFVMNKERLKVVDMRHQLAQLQYILGEVINHAENNDCFGTVNLILYGGIIICFFFY